MRCTEIHELGLGNNLINIALDGVDEVCLTKDGTTTCRDIIDTSGFECDSINPAQGCNNNYGNQILTDSTQAILNAYMTAMAINQGGITGCNNQGNCMDGSQTTCNADCTDAAVTFLLGQGLGLFNTSDGWSGNLNNVAPTSGYWLNTKLATHTLELHGECAFDPYLEDPEQYCEEGGYGGGCENETDECYNPDIYDLCPTGDYACATAENCNALFPCPTIPDFPSIYIQGNILCTDEEAPHPDCTAAGELILVYNFFGYTGETGDFIQIMENSFYSIIGLANYDTQNGTDVATTGIIPDGLTPQDICDGPCWANGTTVNTNYYDSLGNKFDGANSVAIIPGLGPVWNLFGPSLIESGRGYYVFTDTAGYLKW